MSISKVEGKLIAKLGDQVVCSCKGGPHRIVSGSPTTKLRGVPVARVGDKSSCGASIVTGTGKFKIRGAKAALDGSKTSCGGTVIVSGGGGSNAVAGGMATAALGMVKAMSAARHQASTTPYSGAARSSATNGTGTWPPSAAPSPAGPWSRGGPSDPYVDGATRSHANQASSDDDRQDTFTFGKEIDELIDHSPLLKRDLAKLKRDGWVIYQQPWEWGCGSATYHGGNGVRQILIDPQYQEPKAFVRVLSHEVGHATSPLKPDTSSRTTYIDTMLEEEGWAILYNLRVRDEIEQSTARTGEAVDIGFSPDYFNIFDIYIQDFRLGNESPLRVVRKIGEEIRHRAISSGTGTSPHENYGRQYDQFYGAGESPMPLGPHG